MIQRLAWKWSWWWSARALVTVQRDEIDRLRAAVNAREAELARERAALASLRGEVREAWRLPALERVEDDAIRAGLRRLTPEGPELTAILALLEVHREQALLEAEEPANTQRRGAQLHAAGGAWYLRRLKFELRRLHAEARGAKRVEGRGSRDEG